MRSHQKLQIRKNSAPFPQKFHKKKWKMCGHPKIPHFFHTFFAFICLILPHRKQKKNKVMKALMISLFAMWISSSPIYAVGEKLPQNTMMATDDEEEEIPLNIIEDKGVNPFSLFHPTAYATLSNKVVSVDLSELPEGTTVTITRMVTGEKVYSQTGMGSMEIDLSVCGKGQYQIDIVSGGLWLQGEFIL